MAVSNPAERYPRTTRSKPDAGERGKLRLLQLASLSSFEVVDSRAGARSLKGNRLFGRDWRYNKRDSCKVIQES